MPSLGSWILQSTLVTSGAGLATFFVFTKHVKMHDLEESTEPLFRNRFYHLFYPRLAGSSAEVSRAVGDRKGLVICDVAVRKIPVWQVRRDLIEDAEKGGSKLVEAFSGAVWGGFGYSIQRKVLELKYRNTPAGADQLWDKKDLLESTYEEGTNLTNHFNVLSKTPTSILFRGGDSPLTNPTSPRPTDGLIEITATPDMERGFVEFALKSIFFDPDRDISNSGSSSSLISSGAAGAGAGAGAVVVGEGKDGQVGKEDLLKRVGVSTVVFLHQQYTKLMVECGVRKVLA